jgi:hypothetical protein
LKPNTEQIYIKYSTIVDDIQPLAKITVLGLATAIGIFGILATGVSQAFADSNQVHNNIHCSGVTGGSANGGNSGNAGGDSIAGNGGIGGSACSPAAFP